MPFGFATLILQHCWLTGATQLFVPLTIIETSQIYSWGVKLVHLVPGAVTSHFDSFTIVINKEVGVYKRNNVGKVQDTLHFWNETICVTACAFEQQAFLPVIFVGFIIFCRGFLRPTSSGFKERFFFSSLRFCLWVGFIIRVWFVLYFSYYKQDASLAWKRDRF